MAHNICLIISYQKFLFFFFDTSQLRPPYMVLFKKWDQLPGLVEVTYINQDDATLLASLTDTLRCDRRNIWIVSRQIRTVVIKHRRFGKSDILDQRFVLIPKLFCFHIFIQFWLFGFEMTLLANSNSDSEQPKKWLFLLLLLPGNWGS